MDYVVIGGKSYDVIVSSIEENFNILYSDNTGRTLANGARMVLDPLGTFFGHKITFQRKNGNEKEFDELFEFVSVPRTDGIAVEIVHNQQTLKYEAYISNGSRSLKRIDAKTGKVFWGELTLNIVPMEAQVLP